MAIKEYSLPRSNLRPIYRKQTRSVGSYVPGKAGSDAKEAAMLPLAKGQTPIAQQGRSPNYDAKSIMGLISSLRSPGEVNPTFDPNAPVGGENVPYKGTSGAGGLFSRIFGNRANEMNVEAQQTQAAEMRDKAAREEERQFELEKVREADKGPAARFETAASARKGELEAERETRKGEREQDRADRLARETAEETRRTQERQDRLDQALQENALRDAEIGLRMSTARQPRYGAFGTDKGGMTIYNQLTGEPTRTYTPGGIGTIMDPKTGKPMPGMVPGGWEEYKPLGKVPANLGGAPVNRNTGATLGAGGAADTMGGPVPLGPENQNTALLPRFGRVLGGALSEAGSAVTDPLRVMGTEAYKSLLSSGAQQNPEVLKRIKAREARMANYPEFDFSAPIF